MTAYLSAFLCTALYVFTRSFQQKNVQDSRYWFIMPTSLVMGTLDVILIGKAAISAYAGTLDWILCISFGLGGGLGSMIAVYIHDKYVSKKGATS